ncbi:hypothetical protein SprV_0200920500 [Sparganum proliferum]
MLSKDYEKVPLFLQKETLDLFYQCKKTLAPKTCTDDEFVHTMLLQLQKLSNPSQYAKQVEATPKTELTESSPLELAHSTPIAPPTPPPPPPSLAKKSRFSSIPPACTPEKVPPVPVSPFMCFCNSVFPDIQSYFAHVSNCSQVLKTLRGRYSNLPLADFPPLSSSFDSKFSHPPKSEHQSPEPRISHRSSKVFVCSICSKGFTSKLSLKQHVDGKHRAEGKYVCQVCGKRYRWGASFYYHRRTCISAALPKANNTSDVPSLPHHISQPSA